MSIVRNIFDDFHTVVSNAPGVFVSITLALFLILTVGLVALGIGPSVLVATDDEDIEEQEVVDPADVIATEHPSAIADIEPPTLVDDSTAQAAVLSASTESEPLRLIVSSVGIDTPVLNPQSQDINALNEALNSGAVHYPGSGNLEDITNMFIFGHSSHLPVVNNEAYKALNDLEDTLPGDLIRVQSTTKEYHYRITSIELVSADNAWVEFQSDIKKLTLSTCNNFGSKQDRFVVEAEWIGEFLLE